MSKAEDILKAALTGEEPEHVEQVEETQSAPEPDPRLPEWQRRAAALYKLPPSLAERLTGTSEVTVNADARKLAKSLEVEQRAPSVEALILAKKQATQIARADELVRPRPRERGPDFGT